MFIITVKEVNIRCSAVVTRSGCSFYLTRHTIMFVSYAYLDIWKLYVSTCASETDLSSGMGMVCPDRSILQLCECVELFFWVMMMIHLCFLFPSCAMKFMFSVQNGSKWIS